MEKRKPGRPEGTLRGRGRRVTLTLPADEWAWLEAQSRKPTKTISRLIRKAILLEVG